MIKDIDMITIKTKYRHRVKLFSLSGELDGFVTLDKPTYPAIIVVYLSSDEQSSRYYLRQKKFDGGYEYHRCDPFFVPAKDVN
jgi:hypothetical protein